MPKIGRCVNLSGLVAQYGGLPTLVIYQLIKNVKPGAQNNPAPSMAINSKQYGKPSPMGGFQIDPKNETGTAAFVKEHDELLAIEVEIEYKPIKLSELEKNGIELSRAEVEAIM